MQEILESSIGTCKTSRPNMNHDLITILLINKCPWYQGLDHGIKIKTFFTPYLKKMSYTCLFCPLWSVLRFKNVIEQKSDIRHKSSMKLRVWSCLNHWRLSGSNGQLWWDWGLTLDWDGAPPRGLPRVSLINGGHRGCDVKDCFALIARRPVRYPRCWQWHRNLAKE